jgi:hypothetical protein
MLTSDAERDEVQQLVVGTVVAHDGKVVLLQRPADDFMGITHCWASARSGGTLRYSKSSTKARTLRKPKTRAVICPL